MTVLNEARADCNALTGFGKDTDYSTLINQASVDRNVVDFMNDNDDVFTDTTVGTTLAGLYEALDGDRNMYLYGRSQIETTCSHECRTWLMAPRATALLTQMNECYSDVKVILYLATFGSGIGLIVMFFLVRKRNSATQKQYLYFYIYCMVVLIIVSILLCYLVADMKKIYNVKREELKFGANCITNANWKALPNKMYKDTNMDSEHSWATAWLTFTVIMIVVCGVALYFISTGLDNLKKKGWVQTDRDMYA